MTRDYSLFIKDILEAINDIEDFIGDMNFEAFCSDRKTRTAVVHGDRKKIGPATGFR